MIVLNKKMEFVCFRNTRNNCWNIEVLS